MNDILIKKLEKALDAYDKGQAIMSDYDYDCLIAELRSSDPKHKFLQKISNQGGDFKHKTKMLSLDKIHTPDELIKWFNKVKYFCSFKLDGIAISIHYILRDDYFYIHKAVTRGDGSIGKDVTHIIHGIDLPNKIQKTNENYTSFEVRGEAIMDRAVFAELKKSSDLDYNTPRNLVAGSFNTLKDPDILRKRGIKFIAYNLIADGIYNNISDDDRLNIKFSINWKYLRSIGFETVPKIVTSKYDEIMKWIKETEDRRNKIPYDIDGIVIQRNNIYRFLQEGFTDHHPKGAIAYKFKPNITKAIINAITWQLGRTGILTPVAEIEPIELNGVLIKRATLHNLTFIEDKNITIGSVVELQRSGDVIPKINKVLEWNDDSYLTIPKKCPKCGEPIIKKLSISNQYNLYCDNPTCKGKLELKILYWLNMTGCKGIGDKLIIKMVRRRFISKIADLYSLSPKRLMMLDKIKIKSANNIWNAIQDTKEITTAQFMAGLGIEGVGMGMAEKISEHFDNDFSEILRCSYPDFEEIDGVGSILAKNIDNYFTLNYEEIAELLSIVKIKNVNDRLNSQQKDGITGLSFCISGKVSKGKAYYYNLIDSYGGIIHTSVSKKLDVLISNETSTSKVKKANEYKIKIINEKELNDLIYK
jgi:DNA ligase (NAD+)